MLYCMGMIITLLKLKPMPETYPAVLDTLRYIQDRVRIKPGCLDSSIYQECSPDSVVLYLEQWESKEKIGRHIQSETYLRVLNSMDLCREKPELWFHEVSKTRDMAWVAELRLKIQSF
jgi:quinol monooxygenase YgiN